MHEIEFEIQADQNTFTNWLKYQMATQYWHSDEYGVWMTPPLCNDSPDHDNVLVVACECVLITLPDGGSYEEDGRALEFELIPLAANRTKVRAACYLDLARQYFASVLRMIAEDYPEAQAAVEKWQGDDNKLAAAMVPAAPAPADRPHVPAREADRERWVRTWPAIRGLCELGRSTSEIETWLPQYEPDLALRDDTLRKIIKAGKAGLLT